MAEAKAGAGSSAPTIFLAAGEPSGDLHGAALARALRERIPSVRLIGLGGSRMQAEDVRLLATLDDLAVMGFAEVLARLPFFWRLRRRVFDTLIRERVDLVIPIDYPGFNLRLARFARQQGIRVMYYIAPQVWAWHASRARDLARDADRIAVILPFEGPFLQRAGARAEFVGHPLLDSAPLEQTREQWCQLSGVDPLRPVLALFPGSRGQEIRRHLALFCNTAREVVRRNPSVQPLIAASPDVGRAAYATAEWPLVETPKELLHFADAALVKSGTTTLEAALVGTPFVVVYRMNPLTYQLARRVVRVPHIALANLVADERLVPEFIQDAASPDALSDAILPLLDPNSVERARMRRGFQKIRAALGAGGAARRVAESAAELLGIE